LFSNGHGIDAKVNQCTTRFVRQLGLVVVKEAHKNSGTREAESTTTSQQYRKYVKVVCVCFGCQYWQRLLWTLCCL